MPPNKPVVVKKPSPAEAFRMNMQRNPKAVRLFFEGDSWFDFPEILRTNIVEVLQKRYERPGAELDKVIVLDSSNVGDEAREILCGRQYADLMTVMGGERLAFDAILFSGGGNDLVANNMGPMLKPYKQGMSWEDCINLPRFTRRLKQIELAYADLADLRDDLQPNAWILTHSYDFAVPSGAGVKIFGLTVKKSDWIQLQMKNKGIPDAHQQAIVTQMLERFDDMLLQFEQTRARWRHVRTQGTLTKNDWGDEMHPTKAGFAKIADKFAVQLEDIFPQLK